MIQNQFKIDILGTSFTISTGDDPEYVKTILELLKEKIQETRKKVSINDPLKLAIITALFLTEELMKTETDANINKEGSDPGNNKRIGDITDRLIWEIDQVIKGN